MKFQLLLIFLLLVIMFACNKNDQPGKNQYVTLSYKQTYCSDPWRYSGTDSLALLSVEHFLDSSGLYAAGLNITQDGTSETCLACACKTGKTIFVSTLNDTTIKAKYLAIGFR